MFSIFKMVLIFIAFKKTGGNGQLPVISSLNIRVILFRIQFYRIYSSRIPRMTNLRNFIEENNCNSVCKDFYILQNSILQNQLIYLTFDQQITNFPIILKMKIEITYIPILDNISYIGKHTATFSLTESEQSVDLLDTLVIAATIPNLLCPQ